MFQFGSSPFASWNICKSKCVLMLQVTQAVWHTHWKGCHWENMRAQCFQPCSGPWHEPSKVSGHRLQTGATNQAVLLGSRRLRLAERHAGRCACLRSCKISNRSPACFLRWLNNRRKPDQIMPTCSPVDWNKGHHPRKHEPAECRIRFQLQNRVVGFFFLI